MRQKNLYRVAVTIFLTVAIIPALLFFIAPGASADITPQDLPTITYSGDNGHGYGSNISIFPTEVTRGEKVTVSVTLVNTGDVKETYQVALEVDGVVEATREVTIDAGASKVATFTLSRDVPGTYAVSVEGLSGSFVVKQQAQSGIRWWLIGGITAAVVTTLMVIWLSVIRRID